MYYDLHIHSGLSPCAEDDMSPHNIVQMAKIKGLQMISVCDHNSLKQQSVIAKLAKEQGLEYVYGIEIQTKEEVHVLAYFKDDKTLPLMQEWITRHQMKVLNRSNFFGHQYLYDHQDQIIDEEKIALIFSLSVSLEDCLQVIHAHQGKAVLAHIYGRKNGIIYQLGFIPEHLPIDGVEVSHEEEVERFIDEYPRLSKLPCFVNSDAHYLSEIHEASFAIHPDILAQFWGD